MKQIMDMAAALGVAPDGGPPPEQLPEKISDALHHAQAIDRKQEALVHALLPYLQPGRQARLERAMQIARLSHLAGAALRSGEAPSREEADHV